MNEASCTIRNMVRTHLGLRSAVLIMSIVALIAIPGCLAGLSVRPVVDIPGKNTSGVVLVTMNGGSCTGVLVTPLHVLTAAHCMLEMGVTNPDQILVYNAPDFDQSVSVAQYVTHPDYVYPSTCTGPDVAILLLAEPIPVCRWDGSLWRGFRRHLSTRRPSDGFPIAILYGLSGGYRFASVTSNTNPDVAASGYHAIFNPGYVKAQVGDSGGPLFYTENPVGSGKMAPHYWPGQSGVEEDWEIIGITACDGGEGDLVLFTASSRFRNWADGLTQLEGVQGHIFTSQVAGTVPLYELYSATAGDHFYTISSSGISPIDGWQPIGVAGYVYSESGQSEREPLYRWYKPSPNRPKKTDHFYTTSQSEPASNSGYIFEGIECYLPGANATGVVPLYRWYKASINDHFYTTSQSEPSSGSGYVSEGITGYVYSSQSPGTVPLYRLYSNTAKDHFYTISQAGANPIGTWLPEGQVGYVYAGPAPSNRQALYRWYKPSPYQPIKTDHFYTTSEDEPSPNSGYVFERIECYLPLPDVAGSVPLYRFYNSALNDHYYSTDRTEGF